MQKWFNFDTKKELRISFLKPSHLINHLEMTSRFKCIAKVKDYIIKASFRDIALERIRIYQNGKDCERQTYRIKSMFRPEFSMITI